MSNVQLTDSKQFYSQMQMHTSTPKNDVSMAKEHQKNLRTYSIYVFNQILSLQLMGLRGTKYIQH